MRKINDIIVHCTATRAGVNYTASDIRRWHVEKGWSDIGYHYVIDLDGTLELGRPVEQVGAHCYGHNENSIGVVYVGGLNEKGEPADTRTEAQRVTLKATVKHLAAVYNAEIHGHCDYSAKSCPCFDVHSDL